MIILGVILLIVGFVAKIAIIWTIGIITVVIGAILALLGMAGHAVAGRRHYYCTTPAGILAASLRLAAPRPPRSGSWRFLIGIHETTSAGNSKAGSALAQFQD
jgi:uncharacterized membrane protein HdeD (DUF308 family)